VIRARLSDAKFFYETDLKTKLEDRLEKLKEIVFHEKLGTQYERVERIERARAPTRARPSAPIRKRPRAPRRLAKADLVTEMVGEFPELQGLMGKYYALAQGEDASIAAACEEHYKPVGPNDRVPTDPGEHRGRAGGQDRYAGGVLGDRREADRKQGPLCAAQGGAGGDQAYP